MDYKDLKIIEKEFSQNFQRVKSGKLEMTNALMYQFVWYLTIPALEYYTVLEQVIITSKPDWIFTIVQTLIDDDQLKFKPPELDETSEEWRGTASVLIVDLIEYHGIQYRSMLLPLLDKKETWEDFFALANACVAFGENDVLDLVTHFADEPENLSAGELEVYADLLVTQNPEKAIILLEKLRRAAPDFQLTEGGVWEGKTYHELLNLHIKRLKSKQ